MYGVYHWAMVFEEYTKMRKEMKKFNSRQKELKDMIEQLDKDVQEGVEGMRGAEEKLHSSPLQPFSQTAPPPNFPPHVLSP